jgi:hypothetical protein
VTHCLAGISLAPPPLLSMAIKTLIDLDANKHLSQLIEPKIILAVNMCNSVSGKAPDNFDR